MTTGAAAVPDADVLLFLDADLGDTATGRPRLLPPVLEDRADMTIATLPPNTPPAADTGSWSGWPAWHPAGHRFRPGAAVVRAARADPRRVRPGVAAWPPGFGVETALTIDLLRAGLRVQEVALRPAAPGHRH